MSASATAIEPIDFARACGPAAVAALACIPASEAARIVREVQRERAEDGASDKTSLATMLIALRRFALIAEPFDPSTVAVIETAEEFFTRITTKPVGAPGLLDLATAVIDEQPLAERSRHWGKFWAARHRSRPTLRLWREPATWLLVVESRQQCHAVAVRHRRIIAGDDLRASGYGSWPIVTALRVVRE